MPRLPNHPPKPFWLWKLRIIRAIVKARTFYVVTETIDDAWIQPQDMLWFAEHIERAHNYAKQEAFLIKHRLKHAAEQKPPPNVEPNFYKPEAKDE